MDTRYLMGVLADLAQRGHEAAVAKLITAWGGTRRLIPIRPGPSHELVRLVGMEAALVLAELRGGQEIQIPRGVGLGAKKAEILRAAGSARTVAAAVGCTQRFVEKVRGELRAAEPEDQGKLF